MKYNVNEVLMTEGRKRDFLDINTGYRQDEFMTKNLRNINVRKIESPLWRERELKYIEMFCRQTTEISCGDKDEPT